MQMYLRHRCRSEVHVCLQVIASHQRSALKEFFVGSVSQYVLKNCPVTTILLH